MKNRKDEERSEEGPTFIAGRILTFDLLEFQINHPGYKRLIGR